MTTLELTEVRGSAALALAPGDEDDYNLYLDLPDAVHPPCVFLDWVDPWLEPQVTGMGGGGYWLGRLDVVCVASRVQPGAGVSKLEELVSLAIARLQADELHQWPAANLQAPRVFTISGVPYLGARIAYRLPVSI